jgi:threonine/homoserine/homoserine lactone efflux protein
MVAPDILLTYTLIVLGFVFIPGPATMLTVARATTSGTKAGLATAFGVALGDVLHTVFAVIGLSALVLASATLFTLVKYLGAAYLIYLGLKAILARPEASSGDGGLRVAPAQAFKQAILAEVLNPKTALFFVAFLPQFVVPEAGNVAGQLAIFGAVMIVLGLLSTVIFALASGWVGHWLRTNRTFLRWQGKVVGAIYCTIGFRLALVDR